MCGTGLAQRGAFQSLPQGHDHKLLNKDILILTVTSRYWAVHRVVAMTLNPEGGFLARQGQVPLQG